MNETNKKERLRVLIADYGKVYPGISKECLEIQGGLEIENAFTKKEVIEKIEKFRPDVIILDIAPYTLFFKDTLAVLKSERIKTPTIVFAINVSEQMVDYPAKIVDGAIEKFGDPAAVYAELKKCVERAACSKVNPNLQIA